MEEPQELTLPPIPIELNPTANAHATYNPLPVALYPEPLHILLIPATQFTPERTGKTEASPSALLLDHKDIYKFITLLPKDYCLIPGNGVIKLVRIKKTCTN